MIGSKCGTCSRVISTAPFCPFCGAATGQASAPLSLDDVLGRWQLHVGHDYRRSTRDAAGATTAVFMLGAAERTILEMMALLPEHQMIERSRRPGIEDHSDWLRVDIVPRYPAA